MAAKKLRSAGRWWAEYRNTGEPRAAGNDNERAAIAAELEELGADPAEVMAGWTGGKVDAADFGELVEDGCLVLPLELAAAVKLFTDATTQWRWISNGWDPPRRAGLDYAGLQAAAAMDGVSMSSELFQDVRTIEAGALAAFAER